MPTTTRTRNVPKTVQSAKQVGRAPAPAPERLSTMQQAAGNQGMAELLGGSTPLPPSLAPALQRAAGNRAVQRLYTPPRVTPAPTGVVQRLTEDEVRNSKEMTEEEQKTFAEWLTEKDAVEKEVVQHRAKEAYGKTATVEHKDAEEFARSGVEKYLGRIKNIAEMKAVLAKFKEHREGKARGELVKSPEQIKDIITQSGLAKHVDISKFKRMEVLKWRDYQVAFRVKQKRFEKLEAISGFTHGGDVFIVEGSNTVFTALHEALHAVSKEELQKMYGFDFNEGVTEMLTRQTAREQGLGEEDAKYRAYNDEVLAVQSLTKNAGANESDIVNAYFGGNLESLTGKLNDKYEARRVAKIKSTENLLETANKMIRKAQDKKKPRAMMSEDYLVQSALQGLRNKEYTLEVLEEEYSKSNPSLLEKIKETWANDNSK